ncbi:MAG: hypothetical protein ACLQVI_18185 [Polyangiaceae bacterium]|jgi:hypothetical protein
MNPALDIRDIRGPIAIPPWWHWPLAIALAVLAAASIVLLVRWWRSRAPRALSPLDRARQALATAEALAREGRSREWAEIVAETTRGALAARLGTDVLPQTTAELSQAAWTKPPASDELDATRLLALLETCDLARFAKARLDTEALVASTTQARELAERLFTPAARPAASAPLLVETVPS